MLEMPSEMQSRASVCHFLESWRAAGASHVSEYGLARVQRCVLISAAVALSFVFRLAYGSLHEASTVLFPSGCPLCRRYLLRQRTPVVELGGVNEAEVTPPPHCDICELSARVVMRGVGLMERNKDYDSAFHYLEILLQVRVLRSTYVGDEHGSGV